MKKIILALILFSGFVANSQDASSYTTTTSQMRFNNPDLLQVYGAILGGAPSGTQTILGNVGGFTALSSSTITTSASPDYSSGDNVGGIITLTLSSRSSGGTGVISDLVIWDKDAQVPDLVIDYYDASPAGTYTDNSAQVMAGDHGVWLGRVKIYAADWETTGAISTVSIPVAIAFKTVGGTSLYFTIKTKSAINASSTSEFVVKHKLLQD